MKDYGRTMPIRFNHNETKRSDGIQRSSGTRSNGIDSQP